MLRIISLGGSGHVTNNMYVYEYKNGDKVQRLIVDCGIGFPEQEMLGADLLLPDISYLKGKEDTIVGLVLTHGHDDHIAALPYILPQLEADFPIYGSKLTAGFAQDDLDEFSIKRKIKTYPEDQPLYLGDFMIDPINVTHSIPDTKHLVIRVGGKTVYHGSDFKLDWTPVDGVRPDLSKMSMYAREGVDLMLTDCLRIEKSGYSLSESEVGPSLRREMLDVKGKIIITTMSSNVHRIQQAINEAVSLGRKVAFLGRSLEQNMRTAQKLGFVDLPEKSIINKRRIHKFQSKELCLIVAGSQGQIGSTLTRMAKGEYRLTNIGADDKVIFSADPIPGNEQNVYNVIDDISQIGSSLSYHDIDDDLHVSGHASSGELKLMLNLISPKAVNPIGGTVRHMHLYRDMAIKMGYTDQQILIPKSGGIIEIDDDCRLSSEKIKLRTIIVDGLGMGDVGPEILADRKKMSQAGVVVAFVKTDKSGFVVDKPKIDTRGFVFTKYAKNLLQDIVDEVEQLLPIGMNLQNWQEIEKDVVKSLQSAIQQRTEREPLIMLEKVIVV